MFAWLTRLPLAVTLIGLGGIAMLVPAAHATAIGEARTAEIFFFYSGLNLLLALFIGIALAGRKPGDGNESHLLGLLVLFVAQPFLFAMPFYQAIGNTTFLNAYAEMVSDLTTTGATMFDNPTRLSAPLHSWRAIVGWLGGLIILVGAIAVMAPMALGGFELRRRPPVDEVIARGFVQITDKANLSHRVRMHAVRLFPAYTALTLLLWALLLVAGDLPHVAMAHAMSTLSTSGISPTGGLAGSGAGGLGELLVAPFLIVAISSLILTRDATSDHPTDRLKALRADPEIRLGLALVTLLPLFLFLRHFWGAYEIEGVDMSLIDGIGALWGSLFTVLSFLTTTGWESAAWADSQGWSGLQTPGLILIGLALIGGGVATTAGGAKLLRVVALYKHGARELGRLVHPHSVAGAGGDARHMRRRGAYMAWLFLMLMALSLSLGMLGFALTGASFDDSLVLSVASLTTTGPLAGLAGAQPISYGALSDGAKYVLIAAMIIGRLETLAIVALFNPELWRR
ncbi:MAG: potassium transporter TrkG [Maritimibacter sp.]|jgi:trk system potassium uptake protein